MGRRKGNVGNERRGMCLCVEFPEHSSLFVLARVCLLEKSTQTVHILNAKGQLIVHTWPEQVRAQTSGHLGILQQTENGRLDVRRFDYLVLSAQ